MIYKFWGKVRKANLRGKKLGFPTANVNLFKKIPEGIYISKTKVEGKIFKSLTFIGTAKTFAEFRFHAETYILDFSKNIYGQWVTVELIKKIRGNRRFKTAKDLVDQMKRDERQARQYFAN